MSLLKVKQISQRGEGRYLIYTIYKICIKLHEKENLEYSYYVNNLLS